MKKLLLLMLVSSVLLSRVAWSDEGKEEHGHGEKKEAHDDFLKIGDIGFLKMKVDKTKGTLTVDLLKTDKKTALTIDGDLKLNATQGSEKKELILKTKEGTSTYDVTDDFLKKEIGGRFVFKSGDKQHVVKIEAHTSGNIFKYAKR